MNLTELMALTHWIDEQIRDAKIPERYDELHTILYTNAQPNQESQPFEEQKNRLFEALKQVPLDVLTNQQLEFLRCLGIGAHVGPSAVSNLEDVLFRNALDIATVANRIESALDEIRSGVKRAHAIRSSLEGCVPEEAELGLDEVLVRVTFAYEAAIQNVVDLKEWGAKWHEIARGLALANGQPPEAVRVVGAARGSIVIDLAVGYGVAKTVVAVLHDALEIVERVFRIRLQAEEVRGLRLRNDELATRLEEEAALEKEEAAEIIADRISSDWEISGEGEGEQMTALRRSVKTLVEFLDQGGNVDCVLPAGDGEEEEEPEEVPEELKTLRQSFEEIRGLERTIKLLESGEERQGAD